MRSKADISQLNLPHGKESVARVKTVCEVRTLSDNGHTYCYLVFHHPLFHSRLKPSFSANPSHCSSSFLLLKYSLRGFPGLFTVISEHICFLLLVFLFLHFLVVGSVR